jgi:hypothetical protein
VSIWQVDFYRRPLQDNRGQPLWELVVCDSDRTFAASAFCPQSEVSAHWVVAKLTAFVPSAETLPVKMQVFRPQTLHILEQVGQSLQIPVEPTRHTPVLKTLLRNRAADYSKMQGYTGEPYDPLALDRPPPLPLPEDLWGDQWRFAAITAGDFELLLGDRPIPIRAMPPELLPLKRGLASTVPIPGVVIYGGRQSMRLARWLQDIQPAALSYVPGEPDGLLLDAGLLDRWIIATFTDPEAIAAARTFQQRLEHSQGLHFLLVQPDESDRTFSGLWLLEA